LAIDTPVPSVNRETDFSHTFTYTSEGLEVVESITVVPLDTDSGVEVDGDTISGRYNDIFEDVLKYFTVGLSDKIEVPTEVIGTSNVPDNNTVFSLREDPRFSVIMQYDVTVVHTLGTVTETIDHEVLNVIGSGMNFLNGWIPYNV
jgi:hypothetical protein